MSLEKIKHTITHETKDYIHGETYMEDGSFFGRWVRWKGKETPQKPDPVLFEWQVKGYSSRKAYEESEEWQTMIRETRRKWIMSLPFEEGKATVERLKKEKYNMFGDEYAEFS